jgi:hypothetical protein
VPADSFGFRQAGSAGWPGGAGSTLVHEVVHFYTHPTYQAEVGLQAGTKPCLGAVLSEVLIEEVTEHLSRQVMRARQKQARDPGEDPGGAPSQDRGRLPAADHLPRNPWRRPGGRSLSRQARRLSLLLLDRSTHLITFAAVSRVEVATTHRCVAKGERDER